MEPHEYFLGGTAAAASVVGAEGVPVGVGAAVVGAAGAEAVGAATAMAGAAATATIEP